MSSNCCGTKKQRMNNQPCNHAKTNGHSSSLTNGHANHLTNGHASNHNGVCVNGCSGVEQVANPEMCFFCFEVLYCELYRLDDPAETNFTNEA